jgi:hypothetical protein
LLARDATRGLNTEIWIAASADYCCLVRINAGAPVFSAELLSGRSS